MPGRWSHAAGLGTIGSCLEHAAANTHTWRCARATPGLIWRERAGMCVCPECARPFSHLHHQLRGLHPPLAPPSASSTPPLAGSPWKLLIALRQPGVKLALPEQGL